MFDRACWGQLSKAFACLAQTQWERSVLVDDTHEHDLQLMKDRLWTTSTPCALHDVHNGFKWCVNVFFAKQEFYRDTFVCASACQNISLDCLELLGAWLPTVVQSKSHMTVAIPNSDVQRHFWLSLGCSLDAATVLVDELGVWWDQGSFLLSEEVLMSGQYMEPLSQ
eukprot:4777143-Amphidinium_carterae.1